MDSKGANRSSRSQGPRTPRGHLCLGLALCGLVLGHGVGFRAEPAETVGVLRQPAHRPVRASAQLCLRQVHEHVLPSFEPVGLTASGGEGRRPGITMWSRNELLVAALSPDGPAVETTYRATLPGVRPLAAALTEWTDGIPVVEVFDAAAESVWTVRLPASEPTQVPAPAGASGASGVLRTKAGWIRAHQTTAATVDTSAIVLVGPVENGPVRDVATHEAAAADTRSLVRRSIDRILHMRPRLDGGVLVTEAAFPFTTIAFTQRGNEVWRAAPEPDELRDLLGETDLRYVIATPAISVDDAVLNTFVALRSGHRVSALRTPGKASARYRELPDGLAFLGTFPDHRLLVATRSGPQYKLVLFRWRWIDERQSCTPTPNTGRFQ